MEELGLSSTLGLELLLEVEDQLLILIDVELMDQEQMRTIGIWRRCRRSLPAGLAAVFIAGPAAESSPRRELRLVRAARRSFTGPADFLADPGNRGRVSEYLADMAGPYGRAVRAEDFAEPPSPALGQSYGEMAAELIGSAVQADEPVDLLVLAFSIHDLRPGRPTAAYLSHVTPGTPMAFAVCDQGSAAAFSGLRIAGEYASSAAVRRALLVVVEQSALPYDGGAAVPAQHRAVAMLRCRRGALRRPTGTGAGHRSAPASGRTAGCAARLAAAGLTELTSRGQATTVVLGDALAALWTAPDAERVRVMPPGQPGLHRRLVGGSSTSSPGRMASPASWSWPTTMRSCATCACARSRPISVLAPPTAPWSGRPGRMPPRRRLPRRSARTPRPARW